VAFDATNKAVLSYRVGKRSWEDCRQFIWDLRQRVLSRVQITSDGYAPYAPTIRAAFGRDVDYGQLQKIYEEEERGGEAARRYSPGRVVAVERESVYGSPEEDKISTSFVERNNLTMRMQMRRFTRLTNAFSRKPQNHAAAVSLHFAHFNLCRDAAIFEQHRPGARIERAAIVPVARQADRARLGLERPGGLDL
jgi:IS1 family transposase